MITIGNAIALKGHRCDLFQEILIGHAEQQQPLTLCKKVNLLPLSKSWLQFGFTLSKTNRKSPKKLQNMEVGEEGAIFSLFLREKIVQRAGHPKV